MMSLAWLLGNLVVFNLACVSVYVSEWVLSLQLHCKAPQEQGTALHLFSPLLAQVWAPGRLQSCPVLASGVRQLLRVLPKSAKIPNPS